MQIPTEVPKPQNNTPIDPSSPWELAIYVLFPLVLLGVYFYLRGKNRKKSDSEDD